MSQLSLLAPLSGEAPDPQDGVSDEWYTPRWWYDPLTGLYRFKLDVCASKESAKCERYYDLYADGLTQPWDATWFCNPPYSNIRPWVEKALQAATLGFLGVMLLPAWTDRLWWQQLIEPIRDLNGSTLDPVQITTRFYPRIQFGYPGNPDHDPALHKANVKRWKAEGRKKFPDGAKIYPVALEFSRKASGLLQRHQPVWP